MPRPPAETAEQTKARHLIEASVFVGFILFATGPPLVAGADLEGLAVAFWRVWIACAFFVLIACGYRSLTLDALRLTVVPGLGFGIATAFFYEAAQRTSVANATLIASMQPVVMVAAARFIFGERVGRHDVGWMALALGGATFMIVSADSGGSADIHGDLLAIISIVFSAAYFIFSKRARQTVDTVPFMAGLMFWAGVALTPILILSGQDLGADTSSEWVRLVAIALLPGMGHLLINNAHRVVPFVVIGVAQLTLPVGSATLAWLFLDQTITAGQTVGMAIVIVALGAHTVYRSHMSVPH